MVYVGLGISYVFRPRRDRVLDTKFAFQRVRDRQRQGSLDLPEIRAPVVRALPLSQYKVRVSVGLKLREQTFGIAGSEGLSCRLEGLFSAVFEVEGFGLST